MLPAYGPPSKENPEIHKAQTGQRRDKYPVNCNSIECTNARDPQRRAICYVTNTFADPFPSAQLGESYL